MLYVFIFVTTTMFIYGLMKLRVEKHEHVQRRITMIVDNQEKNDDVKNPPDEPFVKRVISPLLSEIKKRYKRKIPGEKQDLLEKKLLQAGSPFNMTPIDFRLFQITMAVILPLLFGYYGYLFDGEFSTIFIFGFIGIIVSLIFPNYILKSKMKKRLKGAVKELPDILDLLIVSIEAGLGFDAAIGKVVAKKEGILSTEFQRCLEEIRLGKTRREALTGVKERLEVEELQRLISSILQAEKLGIGLVKVLKVQSEEIRELRRQKAEEEAMKVPVKMLFPLVLFIFPSLFIVLLGPAVIQFIMEFSK
jgi:tight adherence protein C